MLNAQATVTVNNAVTGKEEEIRNVARLCQSNPRAVAEHFAPLIWKVIGRMARRLPPYVQAEDLYGVGALGLMDAVEKFDASKGAEFPAYAEYRIRGAILDELRHRDPMPRVLRGRLKGIDRRIQALRHELGREPTEEEAAAVAEMSLERYQDFRLQVERATTISYNDALAGYYSSGPSSKAPGQNVPQANSAFMPELAGGSEGQHDAYREVLRREKLTMIAERVADFEERDQLIMALHYQEGFNFRQIGEILGLTESRISQIHKAIIQALRSQLEGSE